MVTIEKPAKSNLLSLASWDYLCQHEYLDTSNTKSVHRIKLYPKQWICFLVNFLAAREAVVPLTNDTIISGRSVWIVRHLEIQNPSIIL